MSFIIPKWPAPENVFSAISTREEGVSLKPYASFNLAAHVGDDPKAVAINRQKLLTELQLPQEPHWLSQVHGITALDLPKEAHIQEADASFTRTKGVVCAVLTADCLPLLLCNQQGTEVAAIHAGWKGLAAGVVEASIKKMQSKPHELMVYLGPAISQPNFEVGPEVYQAFVDLNEEHKLAFKAANKKGFYFADIYLIAQQKLNKLGVSEIYGGEFCSYAQKDLFYSFRRDQGTTGRMATLIYLKS